MRGANHVGPARIMPTLLAIVIAVVAAGAPATAGAQTEQTITVTKQVEGPAPDVPYSFTLSCDNLPPDSVAGTPQEFTLAAGASRTFTSTELGVDFAGPALCIIQEDQATGVTDIGFTAQTDGGTDIPLNPPPCQIGSFPACAAQLTTFAEDDTTSYEITVTNVFAEPETTTTAESTTTVAVQPATTPRFTG